MLRLLHLLTRLSQCDPDAAVCTFLHETPSEGCCCAHVPLTDQHVTEGGAPSSLPLQVGRTHEGLQVYGFGSVSVVLDNLGGVIRAQLGPRWAPLSLDQLLSLVLSRPGR